MIPTAAPTRPWSRHGRRLRTAVLAAFLIASPFLLFLVVSGVAGVIGFGILLWLCLFVPALAGILLVQLPCKVLLLRAGWKEERTRGAVTLANVLVTVGAWQAGSGGAVSAAWSAVLAGVGAAAAQIWYLLDDRAVFGTQSYVEWKRHG